MKRSVLFDTETTGLDPATGDRVIEVAAIELIDDLPTGATFHSLVDPERDVPPEATRIHGFTRDDLMGKPKFNEIAEGLLTFFGADELIAHNATFDFRFVNAELARCGLPELASSRMVDTLKMAQKRFPGLSNSLDALCRRYDIDLSRRTTHNALLDCQLLADVYLELMGGRQRDFSLRDPLNKKHLVSYQSTSKREPRPLRAPTSEERAAHDRFIRDLKNPIWLK